MGARRSAVTRGEPQEHPEGFACWTARNKADAVIRLLCGESLDGAVQGAAH